MSFLRAPINMISSFMSPEKGYEDAMKEMQRYYDQAQKYQQPYARAGEAQLPMLTGAEGQLLDPQGLQNKWAGGYEMSPYAQDLMKRSTDIGNTQASSMGLAGSSANLENIQRTGSSIMQQDRQQYLDDLMKKYMAGIGIGQNIYGTGAGMAGQMGQTAMGMGRDMGGLAYGAQAAPGQQLGNLIGMGARLYMGGAAGAGGGATL